MDKIGVHTCGHLVNSVYSDYLVKTNSLIECYFCTHGKGSAYVANEQRFLWQAEAKNG